MAYFMHSAIINFTLTYQSWICIFFRSFRVHCSCICSFFCMGNAIVHFAIVWVRCSPSGYSLHILSVVAISAIVIVKILCTKLHSSEQRKCRIEVNVFTTCTKPFYFLFLFLSSISSLCLQSHLFTHKQTNEQKNASNSFQRSSSCFKQQKNNIMRMNHSRICYFSTHDRVNCEKYNWETEIETDREYTNENFAYKSGIKKILSHSYSDTLEMDKIRMALNRWLFVWQEVSVVIESQN